MAETLEIGREYTLNEFEDIFDTSFGYPVGINYRNPDDGERFVVLLSKEGGPYRDEVTSSNVFHYIGEGLEGDQKKTPRNRVLIDAVEESIPIYFFYQYEESSKWEYHGLVDVVDYQKIEKDGRMVFRFTLQRLDAKNFDEYQEAEEEVTSSITPELTEEQEEVETTRKTRSSIFARQVKEQYGYSCAVCGAERRSPEGVPEVEAAHIYPKEEGGKDDVRNGIALCRLHHWAFDHGWFTINDDLKIKVKVTEEIETPEEVEEIGGETVSKPKNPQFEPHKIYLKGHRELHGFE